MGTFHDGKGELHGITVVVDTEGPEVWAGRCDTMDDVHIVLLGADRYEEAEGQASKESWIARAAMVGIHPRHDRIVLSLEQVKSVHRLGDIAPG